MVDEAQILESNILMWGYTEKIDGIWIAWKDKSISIGMKIEYFDKKTSFTLVYEITKGKIKLEKMSSKVFNHISLIK